MSSDISREVETLIRNGIETESDYQKALAIIDELIEHYDANLTLIEALSSRIEAYENKDNYFQFRQPQIYPATATLTVLMDQHRLTTQDFELEIGSEQTVMEVLKGDRKLTSENIFKLAKRFRINLSLF
ncbi:type II toxin-antitoxin system HigA family antitoxin [Cellvibrio sp. PSBB023]|uniref:helix-turn-helix domain-containing protein n=1 Tax=Cellvibrio sp. PSBB023 TaxID=1945512 RepID=UPI00098F3557|nr:hypothetical protein [Cellvibrio sp. PSBB023]AQT61447.1 hypothetical protein B0D95_16030 [Cellvibrio sp. PSBB023]